MTNNDTPRVNQSNLTAEEQRRLEDYITEQSAKLKKPRQWVIQWMLNRQQREDGGYQ